MNENMKIVLDMPINHTSTNHEWFRAFLNGDENYQDFLEKNPNANIFYSTRYGHKPLSSFDFKNIEGDIYLMFGKESAGIPYEILANNIDNCYRLPTTDKIRSLNLSNCAAISLYEVLRQLDYEGLAFEEPESMKGANFLDQFKHD